jgi:hypothetical protein
MENTFGDSRSIILETIIALKNKEISTQRGMAIAANMKVLNDSIQVEINAAKLSLHADAAGKDFGEIMRLGTRPVFEQRLIEG